MLFAFKMVLILISPMILGHLWDVTDKESDCYIKALMDYWIDDNGISNQKELAISMVKAISCCGCKALVGCSSICYGSNIKLAK